MKALKFNCKINSLKKYGFKINGEYSAKKLLRDSEEYNKFSYNEQNQSVFTEELLCLGNEKIFIFIHVTNDFNFDNIIRSTDPKKIKPFLPKEIIKKCVEVIEIEDYPKLRKLSINGVFPMNW